MVPYRFVINNKRTGEDEIAEGQIPDDLWQTLLAFRDEARRVSSCDWVRAKLPGTYRVHFDAGGVRVELIDAPSDSAIAQILHRVRPFVLQSERLYYPRVAGKFYESIPHPFLRGLLAENRAMFTGKDMRQAFVITSHDLELNSETAFDLWVGAFEYHPHDRDPSHKEKFLALHGGPPDDMALAVFRDMLRGKVLAILNLADFVSGIEDSPTYVTWKQWSAGVA